MANFRWVKNLSLFTDYFIKNYKDKSDTGYLLEVDIVYPKTLHDHHQDLPFLCERKDKLLTTPEDKEKQVVHI